MFGGGGFMLKFSGATEPPLIFHRPRDVFGTHLELTSDLVFQAPKSRSPGPGYTYAKHPSALSFPHLRVAGGPKVPFLPPKRNIHRNPIRYIHQNPPKHRIS